MAGKLRSFRTGIRQRHDHAELAPAGQYFDVESGWNHNGFRDYMPQLGRYIEPDPLGRLGSGNNLYVYADSDPLKYLDLLGPMSFNYNVKTYDTGWGPLMGGSTIPSLSSINVDCKCTSGGGYRATVAINFSVSINYGTQGELQHELGHLAIMKDYFSARQSYYSNTYERNYPSMAACEASQRDILNDLQKDFKSLNKLQTDQDDNLQNFWKWFQSIF